MNQRKPLDLLNYHQKARFFQPEIPKEGFCLGHSYMGVQALLSEGLSQFDVRGDEIENGMRLDASEPSQLSRLRLHDLKNLITKYDLQAPIIEMVGKDHYDSYFKSSVADAIADKKVVDHNASGPDSDLQHDPVFQKTLELIHLLNLKEIIPTITSLFKRSDYSNDNQDTNEIGIENTKISKEELKKQVELAWLIRKADYVSAYKKHWQQFFNKQTNTADIEKTRCAAQEDLKAFLDLHDYLSRLLDIETFFTSVALHQKPNDENFSALLEHPTKNQKHGVFLNILAPVTTDNEQKATTIEKQQTFSFIFNIDSIKYFFNTLAEQILEYYKSSTTDSQKLLEKFPFAMVICAKHHAITVGFNIKTQSWSIIDSRQMPSFEADQQNIDSQIFLALCGLKRLTIGSSNNTILLGFNKQNWFLLGRGQNEIQEEKYPELQRLIDRVNDWDGLSHVSSLQIKTSIEIYSIQKIAPHLDKIISKLKDKLQLLDDFYFEKFTETRKIDILSIACSYGDIMTVREILKTNINLNQQGLSKYSPLRYAVVNDHPEIVEFLLENGADPSFVEKDGKTAIDIVNKDDLKMLTLLKQALSRESAHRCRR